MAELLFFLGEEHWNVTSVSFNVIFLCSHFSSQSSWANMTKVGEATIWRCTTLRKALRDSTPEGSRALQQYPATCLEPVIL